MNSSELKAFHKQVSNACYAGSTADLAGIIEGHADLSELWTIADYPLAIAASQNNIHIAQLLLDRGMPLFMNTKIAQKQYGLVSELTLAGVWSPNFHEGITFLIEQGAKLHSKVSSFMPVTRLACMAEYDAGESSEQFFHRIVEAGIDVDVPIGDGQLLLHFLARCNNRYVPAFLKKSKDVNAVAAIGERALTIAVSNGAHFAVNALLEVGADVNYFVDDEKNTLLDRANWVLEYRSQIKLLGNMDGIIDALKKAGL